MKARELAQRLQRQTDMSLARERPKRATVTSVATRDTTGEIEATLVDGHTVYIHAATMYEVAVGDEVWVSKLDVGLARGRYQIAGFHKTSGGSYIPQIRPEAIVDVLDNALTDASGTYLKDASGTSLMQAS
jgi:hypothetical protein